MQRAYVRYNTAATFYFYLTGPQGSYGTAGAATGQSGSLTAYYAIDGGSSVSTGTTVAEVNSSTNAGVYSVTCTTAVTNGYHIVMSLYHSDSTYRAEPLAIYTDNLNPPAMNIGEVHEDATAASNLEAAFDGTGYAGGTIKQEVDVNKVSGDATAATNLEAAFDGTGYAGGTIKQEVDINKVSGDATAATNLEAAFDGTGYAGGTIKQEVDIAKINANVTAAKNLALGAESIQPGECTSGSTTSSIVGTGSLKTVDAFYVGRMLIFTTGDLQYSARAVAAYDGSSKTFTVDPAFTSAPSSGDEFIIV